jgi:hypothetical protein
MDLGRGRAEHPVDRDLAAELKRAPSGVAGRDRSRAGLASPLLVRLGRHDAQSRSCRRRRRGQPTCLGGCRATHAAVIACRCLSPCTDRARHRATPRWPDIPRPPPKRSDSLRQPSGSRAAKTWPGSLACRPRSPSHRRPGAPVAASSPVLRADGAIIAECRCAGLESIVVAKGAPPPSAHRSAASSSTARQQPSAERA